MGRPPTWLVTCAAVAGCGGTVTPHLGSSRDVRINEVLASNKSYRNDRGRAEDWIEIHNVGESAAPMAGWSLADASGARWTFPDLVLAADEYLVVFARGRDGNLGVDRTIAPGRRVISLAADFRVDADRETVLLFDAEGREVDRVEIADVPADLALGRVPGAPEDWVFLERPTPGRDNGADWTRGFAEVPALDPAPGRHDGPIELRATTDDPRTEVRFTTDGRPPTRDDPLFPERLAIERTTVVRLASWQPDHIGGRVTTATYLVGEDTRLPIVSIAFDPPLLFDELEGAYVMGPDPGEAPWFKTANFRREVEIPVHFELVEPWGRVVAEDAGLELHGYFSRGFPKKSFRVKARSRFGPESFDYAFLPDSPVESFRGLLLRNGGNDRVALVRDALAARLLSDTEIDTQAFWPVLVFLNGEYWGVYQLGEPANHTYLRHRYGLDDDEIDLIERERVKRGDLDDFRRLQHFLWLRDLSDPENFARVEEWIDVASFVDYYAGEIYLANKDWPDFNLRYWRPRRPGGRWRCILYDADHTLGLSAGPEEDTLARATDPDEKATMVFRSLLGSPEFRTRFLCRFEDLMNVTCSPERIRRRLRELDALVAPEMLRDEERWDRFPGDGAVGREQELAKIRTFAKDRPEYAARMVVEHFGLAGTAKVDFHVKPVGAGTIRVNREVLPVANFQGTYFRGVARTIRARARPGFRFARWEGPTEGYGPEAVLEVDGDATVTAVFSELPR